MKKQAKIWIGAVLALMGIGVIAALVIKQSDPGLTDKQETRKRVEILKERCTIPLDQETRENIDHLTHQIGLETGVVDVNGTKVALSTAGVWGLREIGKRAIPALIDAATSGRNVLTRQLALGTIYDISNDSDGKSIEFLPLFVLSMGDEDGRVRAAAAAQMGKLALELKHTNRLEQFREVLCYLRETLSDKDDSVREIGAWYLYRIDKREVPSEFVEEYGLH